MSDANNVSVLTEEDKKALEEQLKKLKSELKTSLSDEEKVSMEEIIKKQVEAELRKKLEEEEEKKRQAEREAAEKATQEAYLAKIKELEEKLNQVIGSDGGSRATIDSRNPLDDPVPKGVDDFSSEELSDVDNASMELFFKKRQGLSINPR